MGDAALIHPHISELTRKSEDDRPGSVVVRFYVKDDAQVAELGGQVLILARQRVSSLGGFTGEGEGGTSLGGGSSSRLSAALGQQRLLE